MVPMMLIMKHMFISGPRWNLKIWLCLTFFSVVIVRQVAGAVFIASDTSLSAVNAAINTAVDGDTVLVPAGSSTWPSGITITKGITLKGAGTNQTFITCTNAGLINLAVPFGKTGRITGFTFNGGGVQLWHGLIQMGGGSQALRMDNCLLTNEGGWMVVVSDVFGVIDHCTFGDYGAGIQVFHNGWGGGTNYFGDGSWADGAYLGTTNALYVEDCGFYRGHLNGALDSVGGAHWVFRHNYVTNDVCVCHGTDSTGRPRGTRAVEMYNNVMDGGTITSEAFEMRSGTGVIFSNVLTGYGSAAALKEYRSPQSGVAASGYVPWGPANGSNPYDGNTRNDGYPCIDQCGRGKGDRMFGNIPTPIPWPHQAVEPVYAWSNTVSGAPARIGSGYSMILENRDYYNDTPMPGYTPLVYPHPLVSAGFGASNITMLANSGTITAPFTSSNGIVYQTVSTGVTNGGQAAYNFTLNLSGSYVISAQVSAPNTSGNSFYVNVDSQPTDPAMIWDIPTTSGFVSQTVTWRGNSTNGAPQYSPKSFALSSGSHNLIFVGRQPNVLLSTITVVRLPDPPQGLKVAGP
jgi:hypothetical protein